MQPRLTLYGLATSRCTQAARFALNEKNVPFVFHQVNVRKGEGKTLEHCARHPFGKIPALEVGTGDFFFESVAICRYVDAISTPSLVPAAPLAALAVNQWVSSFIYNFYPHAYIIKTAQMPGHNAPAAVAEAMEKLAPVLAVYAKQLEKGGYLAGPAFSLADVVHQPYLNVLNTACPEVLTGAVREWFEKLSERPAWKEVMEFEKKGIV